MSAHKPALALACLTIIIGIILPTQATEYTRLAERLVRESVSQTKDYKSEAQATFDQRPHQNTLKNQTLRLEKPQSTDAAVSSKTLKSLPLSNAGKTCSSQVCKSQVIPMPSSFSPQGSSQLIVFGRRNR